MKIRRENEITYTMVAAPLLDKMEGVFKGEGFDYEVLYGQDIPEFVAQEIVLCGHRMTSCLCCVKSYMNPEDVREVMIDIWHPGKYRRGDE